MPSARIAAAHLPRYGGKTSATHFHTHLDLLIGGNRFAIPAHLGLVAPFSAVHTHSDSGILHVESDDLDAVVTLGQLFTVWGVRLNDSCIGFYCEPAHSFGVYVNGVKYLGPVRDLPLRPFAEIAVVVGAHAEVPSSYDCRSAARLESASCPGFLVQEGG